MWTLMKYEFRKTWFTKVIFLVMTALAEIAYLAGLYGKNDDVMGTGILFLVLLTVGGILVIGLESVVTLYRDMNTKQAYMLFMTPHSDYAILGAKVLECTLSILLASAFFFAWRSLSPLSTALYSAQMSVGDSLQLSKTAQMSVFLILLTIRNLPCVLIC